MNRYLLVLCLVCWTSPVWAQQSATLQWDQAIPPENDLKGFRIYRDPLACNQAGPKQFVTEVGNVRTYTDTSIPTEYGMVSYNISAIDTANNESPRSNCAEKTFAIPPPSLGVITVNDTTTTTISFSLASVPDGAGGIAKYDVRYGIGTVDWGTAPSVPNCINPGPCTLSALTPATTYVLKGITYRGEMNTASAVFGPFTVPVNATTLAVQNLPPNPPTNLRVTQVAGGNALLAWDPAQGATLYEVKYQNNKNQFVSFQPKLTSTTTTATAPLPQQGMREFQVCAGNPQGTACQGKAGAWAAR